VSLYERRAATPEGTRGLAAARVKREALKALSRAITAAGGYTELAEASGVSMDRIVDTLAGSGNIKIGRLARMLHGGGFELELTLVPAGQPRTQVLERRAEFTQLKADLAEAVHHLGRQVDHEDGPCAFDHHGYCQDHNTDGSAPGRCGTVEAREFLARIRGDGDRE
jgi:DNA-binding phage protein